MMSSKVIDIDNLSDKDVDRLYAERNSTNSLKSMVPLYVYLILQQHSDKYHHLTHKDIINYLREYPYEIEIERKALGRTIYNLMLSDVGIYTLPQNGTWMDQEKSAA